MDSVVYIATSPAVSVLSSRFEKLPRMRSLSSYQMIHALSIEKLPIHFNIRHEKCGFEHFVSGVENLTYDENGPSIETIAPSVDQMLKPESEKRQLRQVVLPALRL